MEPRLLELVELSSGGDPVASGPPEFRSMLAVLAKAANGAVPVETLIDQVWDGPPPFDAADLVHDHMVRLGKALAHHDLRDMVSLTGQSGEYLLAIDPGPGRSAPVSPAACRAARTADRPGGPPDDPRRGYRRIR